MPLLRGYRPLQLDVWVPSLPSACTRGSNGGRKRMGPVHSVFGAGVTAIQIPYCPIRPSMRSRSKSA